MRLSKDGLKMLHGSEACSLKAYLDSGGVPTIGWGSIRMFGNPVKMGMTCTQAQADEQAALDVKATEDAINKLVKVLITQNQFDALVNLVYNIGIPAFSKSTLLRKLNARDYLGAGSEFMRWVYDNGKEVDGLKNRRRREKAKFLE
jgi:lysozyme